MTWGKLDDGFWRHPKVRAADRRDPAAVGLLARAISLASEYETDGRITKHDIEELCPSRRRRRKLVQILLDCRLLDCGDVAGSYVIHDYLDYNKSRHDLDAERASGKRRQHRKRGRPEAFGGGDGEVQVA